MGTPPLIQLVDVSKIYHLESGDFTALNHVSLEIGENDFVAIMGPSGSGKSTIMNQLGILDVPTTGRLLIEGKDVAKMSNLERTHLRRDSIGYIFQKFYLIPLLSAYENVEYPLILKYKKRDTSGRAAEMLHAVGIEHDMGAHRPNQLSGGQQQRVAIARSLVLKPKVLLFDEPTSALDPELVNEVLDVIKELARSGATLIVVTHEIGFAREVADTIAFMDGGRIVESGPPAKILNQAEHPRLKEFLAKVL